MNDPRHTARKSTLRLWALVFYLALLYLALRLGAGHAHPSELTWITA